MEKMTIVVVTSVLLLAGCGSPCDDYTPPDNGCVSVPFGDPTHEESSYGGYCTVCAE